MGNQLTASQMAEIEQFKHMDGNSAQERLFITVNSDRITETADEIRMRDAVPVVDDVVMNGGLYPQDELEQSWESLSGVPAPMRHPEDENGNFISARNGEGLRNYYCGATCENVRYEGGRVLFDLVVNKAQLAAHPDGARFAERIKDKEPIHLSTGLMLRREYIHGNSNGKDYQWIARNMQFDHVAILMDEPGAATPDDGVGLFTNADKAIAEMQANEMSNEDKREMIEKALREKLITGVNGEKEWLWVSQTYSDHVVYERNEEYYKMAYTIDASGSVALSGDPVKVRKSISFIAANAANKILDMARRIVATAAPDGYTDPVNPITDANNGGDYEMKPEEIEALVVNKLEDYTADMAAKVEALEKDNASLRADVEANSKAEHDKLVANASAVSGMDAEDLQGMSVNGLRKLIAKHGSAEGVSDEYHGNAAESYIDEDYSINALMEDK